MEIVWGVLGVVCIVCMLIAGAAKGENIQKALDDPSNTEVIYLDQVQYIAQLTGHGEFHVGLIRQSGNPHSAKMAYSAESAIKAALATFRRAQIDAVKVTVNTPSTLEFWRTFHSHRGRAEGKKVGGVRIQRVA